jgi:ADP-heptose:LPS heptosyltransferase
MIRLFTKIIFSKKDNIVIIAIHKIGDSVFTFKAIEFIKNRNQKDVFIVCLPDSKPIYELIHPAENIIEIPKQFFYFNDRIASLRARKILRTTHPHTIIDITGVMTSATLIFNSSAKEIIGMNREIFKGIFSSFSPVNISKHSSDIYINAIKNYYDNIDDSKFEIKINYPKNGNILIHPFAGWKSKEWNLNKFIDLGSRIASEYNCAIISTPNTIQDDIKEVIKKTKIQIIETQNVRELIASIGKCSLIIGNDSGAIQIAATLGKPTFTIYGPTNPTFHLPLYNEKNNKFIQSKINCTPRDNNRLCYTNGGLDGCPSFECLNLLPVNTVYNTILNFIIELGIEKK